MGVGQVGGRACRLGKRGPCSQQSPRTMLLGCRVKQPAARATQEPNDDQLVHVKDLRICCGLGRGWCGRCVCGKAGCVGQ